MCPQIYADAKHVGALNLSCVCELIGQGLRKMNEPIIVTNGEFLSNGLDNVEVWAGRCQRWAASFLWLIKILFKLGAESSMTSTLSLLTRSLSFFCSCTVSGSGSSDLWGWRELVKASQLAASAARSCFRFRICLEIYSSSSVCWGLYDFMLNGLFKYHRSVSAQTNYSFRRHIVLRYIHTLKEDRMMFTVRTEALEWKWTVR